MQQHNPNIYKIYSRKRLNLRFLNNTKICRKLKRMSPFGVIMIIAISTCYIVWNAMTPIFNALCEDEAKAIATEVTNVETTNVMNEYNYDTFFTIEKDDDGKVQMINANVLKINQVVSDITVKIQNALRQRENDKVYISVGSATGIRFLSGVGPKIGITISSTGTVDTDLKSEFETQGVNQTIHRVYLEVVSTVNILTPFSTIQRSIKNQVLIAENVILGEIPSTYYNLEGIENEEELLDIVE